MDIEEIKETLSKIEEVLAEGVISCEEIDSTANRIYNVVVKQRNQIIETQQKEITYQDKHIDDLNRLSTDRGNEIIKLQERELSKGQKSLILNMINTELSNMDNSVYNSLELKNLKEKLLKD